MIRRFKKIVLYAVGVLVLAGLVLTVISPYKKHSNDYRTVEATIEISAPVDSVFDYMKHSAHASDWSSYVDHITPLNSPEYSDGEVGSERRIFVNADERGARWDERILAVERNHHRILSIYNIHEMTLSAEGLHTEQRYEKLGEGTSKLSLVLYFNEEHDGYWNQLWMHIASFKIKTIFEKNLKNIKREIESRGNE